MSRINCHSSFKHYEMFHSRCGGNNYGSINNTVFNIDCDGHGGFWGGFGFGLGNAFGGFFNNWFGGGMNFGGFGMGGFFPSFGNFSMGGFPSLSGLWGGGNNNNSRVSDSNNNGKCTCSEHSDSVCNDPDRTKLANYTREITNLRAKEDLTPDELKNLYNRILADRKLSESDPNHKSTDLPEYDAMLQGLKNDGIARGWGDITTDEFGKKPNGSEDDGNVDGADDTDGAGDVDGADDADDAGNAGNVNGGGAADVVDNGDPAGNVSEDEITVGGKKTKIDDMTPDQIKGISDSDIKNLTPEQAGKLLKKLGIEDGGVVKDANNITVLLLLEKAGIDVKFAENTHESVTDNWIQGKITNVKKDKDGKISYSVDCTKHGTQKNIYNFVQKEENSNTYKVTIKEMGEGVNYADQNVKEVEYTYDSSKGYLTRNGYKFTTKQ